MPKPIVAIIVSANMRITARQCFWKTTIGAGLAVASIVRMAGVSLIRRRRTTPAIAIAALSRNGAHQPHACIVSAPNTPFANAAAPEPSRMPKNVPDCAHDA